MVHLASTDKKTKEMSLEAFKTENYGGFVHNDIESDYRNRVLIIFHPSDKYFIQIL